MDRNQAWAALHNPNTSAEQLAWFAQNYPEFGPQVAAHPNTYPELTAWVNAPQATPIAASPGTKPRRRGLAAALIGGVGAALLLVVVGLMLLLIDSSKASVSAQYRVENLREKPEMVEFVRTNWSDHIPLISRSGISMVDSDPVSPFEYSMNFYRWEDGGEVAWSNTIRDVDPWGVVVVETGDLIVFGCNVTFRLFTVSLSDGEIVDEYEGDSGLYVGADLTANLLASGAISPGLFVAAGGDGIAVYDAGNEFELVWKITESISSLSHHDGHLVSSEGRVYDASTGEKIAEIPGLSGGLSIPRVFGVRSDEVVYCSPTGDEVKRYNFETGNEIVTDIGKDGLACDMWDTTLLLPDSSTIYLARAHQILAYDTVTGERTGSEIDLSSNVVEISADADLVLIRTSDGMHWGYASTPLDQFQSNNDHDWLFVGHSTDGAILLSTYSSGAVAFDIESGEALWFSIRARYWVEHNRLFHLDATRMEIQE